MIKIMLCDDQLVVTTGLSTVLGSVLDFEIVGVAGNGEEALEKVGKLMPDIILMDLKMPVMNGVEATRKIHERHPEIKVLVLTTYDQDEWVFDAIRAGAAGYLLKDTQPADLIRAIHETLEGKSHVDPAVAGRILDQIATGGVAAPTGFQTDLNAREFDVIGLLAEGLSNQQISARLYLSQGTVRNIVSSILLKLNVEDRTQAAIFAIKHGLGKNRN